MVTVFDAALTVIARHRVYYLYDPDGGPCWRCSGCDFKGKTRSDADIHLATLIDEEID